MTQKVFTVMETTSADSEELSHFSVKEPLRKQRGFFIFVKQFNLSKLSTEVVIYLESDDYDNPCAKSA